MAERRGTHSGEVTHVTCKTCGARVLLDSRKMTVEVDHAELPCTTCGAALHVRLTDVDRPAPDGIWAISTYTDGGISEPKPRGLSRLLKRHAKAS